MTTTHSPGPVANPRDPIATAVAQFSVQEAHGLIRDLVTPRPAIYWADFLASYLIGIGASVGAARLGLGHPVAWVAIVVASLALYRAVIFIHEIVHFRSRRSMNGFRYGWNLLLGIPALLPTFLYDCHREHHNVRLYGTDQDAEYLPLASLPRRRIVEVLASSVVLPLFGPVRFALLTPIGWVVPVVRRYLWHNLSALKLDIDYDGRAPVGRERFFWTAQEVACVAWAWAVIAATIAGIIPVAVLVQAYVTLLLIITINSVRLLGAHRYRGDEDEMSLVEQMMDTINYPHRRLLNELWAPVGLRLHALHHLFPGLPYHAFPAAHRRLVEGLAEDSAYRLTESPGLGEALSTLWREAGEASARLRASADMKVTS